MPNTVRGEFEFKLGDHTFIMVPSFNNLARVEAGLNRSLLSLSGELAPGGRGVMLNDWVTIVDGLAKAPKPSRDAIADMVLEGGIQAMVPLISTLFERLTGGKSAEGN